MPDVNKEVIKKVLRNPHSFATTLVVALLDSYGTELCSWAPETILLEVKSDFGVDMPQTNFDRLMAGIILLTSNRFYQSLPDFIELCGILSGAVAHPGVFSPADADECAWGITEAILLSPPDEPEPFNAEIRAYVGKTVEMEGMIVPPDVLKIGMPASTAKSDVHNNFADDAIMYTAIWKNEEEKTEEINSLVKDRLIALINQLAELPLTNGDTTEIAKKMLTALNEHPAGGKPLP
jgi:hypothetical protein